MEASQIKHITFTDIQVNKFSFGLNKNGFSVKKKKKHLDDSLLYMDPHEVQPYVPNFVEDMNDSTYHTNTMWKLKFSQLDPSVALVI